MYQVATNTQRESGSKASGPVAAVNNDSHSEAKDEEDEVATFQNRRNNRFQNRPKRQNSGAPQRSNCFNSGARSKTNRNGKYSFYCKIHSHSQEECRKRIRDNKPCKDKQGHAYWPKVYVYVPIATVNSRKEINRGSSRFFPKESDDPLHTDSQRHSAINPQFMYHFDRNM
jgi:hypothetical protein